MRRATRDRPRPNEERPRRPTDLRAASTQQPHEMQRDRQSPSSRSSSGIRGPAQIGVPSLEIQALTRRVVGEQPVAVDDQIALDRELFHRLEPDRFLRVWTRALTTAAPSR